MTFLIGQYYGAYSDPGTQVGTLTKDFGTASFADGLNQSLVLSVVQAYVNDACLVTSMPVKRFSVGVCLVNPFH